MQRSGLFYANIIVSQLLLCLIQVKQLAATSQCSDVFFPSAQSGGAHTFVRSWDFAEHQDRLVKLVIPECLGHAHQHTSNSRAVSFNLTYILQDFPQDGYVVVSGNVTGEGRIFVSDGYQSTNQPHFVFYAIKSLSQLNVSYISNAWQVGDGPFLEVFYAADTHSSAIAPRGLVSCSQNGAIPCGGTTGGSCYLATQKCNGYPDCPNGSDELSCDDDSPGSDCTEVWRKCSVTSTHEYICLPKKWRCNGREECPGGIDESDCNSCCTQLEYGSLCLRPDNCMCRQYSYTDSRSIRSIKGCNGKAQTVQLQNGEYNDLQSLPFWPMLIPFNITYIWEPSALPEAVEIAITFTTIAVNQGDVASFYVGGSLYDLSDMTSGDQKTISLDGGGKDLILNIVMMSPNSVYNFTYDFVKGSKGPFGAAPKDDNYVKPCQYKDLYFRRDQLCDGYMDCTNGKDELGCGAFYNGVCAKNEIMCHPKGSPPSCFSMKQRCDGNQDCDNGSDEENCDSTLCGTHNGTYLCLDDRLCIPETGICNRSRDCHDGEDEQNCDVTSLKVITASVIGSLACALMIVIAVGCSYKLHYQRVYESSHQRSRYESPMTRITNELMRRAAPPPYAEAMQRSRPFEEVQSEYHAALELRQREEAAPNSGTDLEEQLSVASASGTLDAEQGNLIDHEGNASRLNRNKPPETNLSSEDQGRSTSITLEPKSDDETAGSSSSPPSVTDESMISLSHNHGPPLRRVSIDSDVSILSHDSEDVALLSLQ